MGGTDSGAELQIAYHMVTLNHIRCKYTNNIWITQMLLVLYKLNSII